jgi:hypothetical protein
MAEKKPKLVEIKTKPSLASIDEFINSIADEKKRNDSFALLEMMKAVTGEEPVMWGNALIGFGYRIYESPATGRQVEWFRIGFSPRKANFSLYLSINIQEQSAALEKLGKHKTGAGCLYINKLDDIDKDVLQGMMVEALRLYK